MISRKSGQGNSKILIFEQKPRGVMPIQEKSILDREVRPVEKLGSRNLCSAHENSE